MALSFITIYSYHCLGLTACQIMYYLVVVISREVVSQSNTVKLLHNGHLGEEELAIVQMRPLWGSRALK